MHSVQISHSEQNTSLAVDSTEYSTGSIPLLNSKLVSRLRSIDGLIALKAPVDPADATNEASRVQDFEDQSSLSNSIDVSCIPEDQSAMVSKVLSRHQGRDPKRQ